MGVMEIIGIAGSVSLLAGWRLYLCIFATGLAMRMNALPLPEHLASLDVLANPVYAFDQTAFINLKDTLVSRQYILYSVNCKV